jgi:hypothetical protein
MFKKPTLVVNETTGVSTESTFILLNIGEVISSHGPLDTDCLVKVCLGCESIAMAATPEDRDMLASHYDFECHRHQTYTFVTHDSGVTAVI